MMMNILLAVFFLSVLSSCRMGDGNLLSEKTERELEQFGKDKNTGSASGGVTTGGSINGGGTTSGGTTSGGTTSGGTTSGGTTSGGGTGGATTCEELKTAWNLNDPQLCVQWHLSNRGQIIPKLPGSGNFSTTGLKDMDILAFNTLKTHKGNLIKTYVTDNGVWKHNDLVPNLIGGYDNISNQNDGQGKPYPGPVTNCGSDQGTHGTMVSGIISAAGNNNLGVAGIASLGKFFSNNLISTRAQCGNYITEAEWIEAINPTNDTFHVWSGSFGASACRGHQQRDSVQDAAYLKGAMEKNISYQKANGNGWRAQNTSSSCREDGNGEPAGSHHAILHIAALDNQGVATDYSTRGANLGLSCFAGYGGQSSSPGIVTTYAENDNDHRYTASMNGTSAATPCTSGAMGVLRSAYPHWKWYDYAAIMFKAARQAKGESPTSTSGVSKNFINYVKNSKGYTHSYHTGFGIVSVDQAINVAKNHTPLPSLVKYANQPLEAIQPLTVNAGSCGDINLNNSQGTDFSIFSAELSFSMTGASYQNIALWLTSSDGSESQLKQWTQATGNGLAYSQYFKSMAPFGLNAKGNWKVTVCSNLGSVNVSGMRINFYGFSGANIIATK